MTISDQYDLPAPGTCVAIGLSGGLDSAMAAALLLERGCSVVAVTMAIWDGSIPLPDEGRSGCYGPGEERDIASAAAVAKRLGTPHHVVRLAREYRDTVLSYVRDEYRAGRTPNPCACCNRRIKFGLLPERLRQAGVSFDVFATGHYARIVTDPGSGRRRLLRGRDSSKDQSYFLSRLSREQLAWLCFPLGDLTKREVREQAVLRGFGDLAGRSESQDFLEAGSIEPLFTSDAPPEGDIVDEAGCVLGRHRGLPYYTIGQRKGLGIGGAGEPYYVVALDAGRNSVVVGRRESLVRSSFSVSDCTWIAWDVPPADTWRAEVCTRLRQQPTAAGIAPDPVPGGLQVQVDLDTPLPSVTPGQIAAFYSGDEVLGAGIIDG